MSTSLDIPTGNMTESELIKFAFGQVVMRARHEAGFKQRPFARVTGISNSHLRSIEAGDVSPTLITICKLAATLETDPSALVAEACQIAGITNEK